MKNQNLLSKFGFAFPYGSPHVSRTMMLAELEALIDYVGAVDANKSEYVDAIITDNCLGKRTDKTRTISKRYLVELYSLDSNILLFRALLYFWQRDPKGHPLLALLCAYARDTLLRASAKFILPLAEGTLINREITEEYLESLAPGRYSPGKLASNAKNLNSTWTQSGHLLGRSQKKRAKPTPTAGSVSYALLIGYLNGERGMSLFQTEFTKLLDCTVEEAIELAQDATRKGWIVLKRIVDVIEVSFPKLINEQELEWLREQN